MKIFLLILKIYMIIICFYLFGFFSFKLQSFPIINHNVKSFFENIYQFPIDVLNTLYFHKSLKASKHYSSSITPIFPGKIENIPSEFSDLNFFYKIQDKLYFNDGNQRQIDELSSFKIDDDEGIIYLSVNKDYILTRKNENNKRTVIRKYKLINFSSPQLEWELPVTSHHLLKIHNNLIYTLTFSDESNFDLDDFLKRSNSKTDGFFQDFFYRNEGFQILSLDGDILFKKNFEDIFKENNLLHLILTSGLESDPFHSNSIDVAKKDFPHNGINKDDVLISMRHLSLIMIYRPESNKVIWWKSGPWLNQHDAKFNQYGDILLFNNNSISVSSERLKANNYFLRGETNEILQINVRTEKIKKKYVECFHDSPDTITGGWFKLLHNNKLLINFPNKKIFRICDLTDFSVTDYGDIYENKIHTNLLLYESLLYLN